MSRIVSAVNAMISSPGKISSVQPASYNKDVLYFLYGGKYTWSLYSDSEDGGYTLCYYPGNQSPQELVDGGWDHEPACVAYRTDELKTREAHESFSELYTLLKEKVYNVDAILDDIIAEDKDYDPFAEE